MREALLFLHVGGATVLIGTGAGIAWFMLASARTREPASIAHVGALVVRADAVLTTPAVILQPVTGALLAWRAGWSLLEPWIALSILAYLAIGALWVPVLGVQERMRALAERAASAGEPLPEAFDPLLRRWVRAGIGAFALILGILWLMIAKPAPW